ncbi:hypothetical protein HWD29_gp099 [Klebsiella phage KpS8]|jgi:hypothetical protein|nr:hypothetical protein HWD29_gp099 [Klebsiella phage KpS8]QIW88415.1 hypothetical protein kps8_243 [Klebsiella phage KpS8]
MKVVFYDADNDKLLQFNSSATWVCPSEGQFVFINGCFHEVLEITHSYEDKSNPALEIKLGEL